MMEQFESPAKIRMAFITGLNQGGVAAAAALQALSRP
jgi:hypothetical protein